MVDNEEAIGAGDGNENGDENDYDERQQREQQLRSTVPRGAPTTAVGFRVIE